MKTVLLLRGINVGGHRKLPMKELCAMLESLGAHNPKHYIQSGNVVFDGEVDNTALADTIESAKGFRPEILTLTGTAFRAIADQLPANEPNGKLLHIWFAAAPFDFDMEQAEGLRTESETLTITTEAIFLHAPDGIGRSKLAAKIETLANVPCTARNLNTVNKLLEMLDA